jgi:hypothetical protein
VHIRVAGIDAAEVGEERDEPSVSLINAVPYAVDARHIGPRVDLAGYKTIGRI